MERGGKGNVFLEVCIFFVLKVFIARIYLQVEMKPRDAFPAQHVAPKRHHSLPPEDRYQILPTAHYTLGRPH